MTLANTIEGVVAAARPRRRPPIKPNPQGAVQLAAVLAGKAPEAPERTPETVLRAMLLAYERAALEAEEAYYRAGRNDEDRSLEASDAADAAVGIVRSALAKLAVYGDAGFDDDGPRIAADYAARLAGTTPLDAPPAP